MNLLVYDRKNHGLPLNCRTSTAFTDGSQLLESACSMAEPVVLVHIGEHDADQVIGALLAKTTALVVLFSGGGIYEPRRKAESYQAQGRLWAYSASELAERLARANANPSGSMEALFETDRLEMVLTALNALWVIQLYLERAGRLEAACIDAAERSFMRLDELSWDPESMPRLPDGAPLSTDYVSALVRTATDATAFGKQLIVMRDALLEWAERRYCS